ncbi:MAG: SDR family oxidoreductase [Acidisphaera sp.]|nr:SDR family oxidoreductase [Acidisphaera sp.]
MRLELQGRNALVTGGAGGIGGAIADALAAEGVAVASADTRPPPDGAGRFLELDVRDRDAVLRAFDAAEDSGVVDILVNAAGLYPSDPILEMSEAAWDRVMDVNVKGMFLTSQEFCRRLVAAGRPGCIVNITSGAAERARVGAAHYCTSKAAAEMLTRAFALEFAEHGIRVNAVSPGYVEVGSAVNPLSAEYKAAITGSIPLGRAGAPADIAQAVLFLCSRGAEWVTGASWRVDGGSRAGTLGLPLSRVS